MFNVPVVVSSSSPVETRGENVPKKKACKFWFLSVPDSGAHIKTESDKRRIRRTSAEQIFLMSFTLSLSS